MFVFFVVCKLVPTRLNSQVKQNLLTTIKLNTVAHIFILMAENQHTQIVRNAPTILEGVKYQIVMLISGNMLWQITIYHEFHRELVVPEPFLLSSKEKASIIC